MSFIGPKKTKNIIEVDGLVDVEYEDGSKETMTKLMYNICLADEQCDLTALREKRIKPIVKAMLTILRDWGIKLSELSYMSAVLNESWMKSEEEALRLLWSKYQPNIKSVEDVDLIMIDKVLKEGTPSPYVEK